MTKRAVDGVPVQIRPERIAKFKVLFEGMPPDACWPFPGYRCPRGYGRYGIAASRCAWAHRVAWTAYVGEIPAGHQVLHRCDNPPCCNPAHLFLGDHAINMADRASKGRYKGLKGSANKHAKLTAEQVLAIRASSSGLRELSLAYGVTKQAISAVLKRKNWAHL